MTKIPNAIPVKHQNYRMDTPIAQEKIRKILSSIRKRGTASTNELHVDTSIPERTLNRYLSYLREYNMVGHIGNPRAAAGDKIRYVETPTIKPHDKDNSKDKANSIRRRLLGANEWRRGEHMNLAAFWPRPQAMAC